MSTDTGPYEYYVYRLYDRIFPFNSNVTIDDLPIHRENEKNLRSILLCPHWVSDRVHIVWLKTDSNFLHIGGKTLTRTWFLPFDLGLETI